MISYAVDVVYLSHTHRIHRFAALPDIDHHLFQRKTSEAIESCHQGQSGADEHLCRGKNRKHQDCKVVQPGYDYQVR